MDGDTPFKDAIRLTPDHAVEYREMMLEAHWLHPEAFTSTVRERADLPISWWRERLSPMADRPGRAVFGYVSAGKLSGTLGISIDLRDKVCHKAKLFGMYVPSCFRGLGVGQALLNRAITYARSVPAVMVVQLAVAEWDETAIALFERNGFLQYGFEPYALCVGSEFAPKIHMWKNLRPSIEPGPEGEVAEADACTLVSIHSWKNRARGRVLR